MKCKCNKPIPNGRLRLGFKVCISCSSVEAYGCAPVINHKTGNGTMLGVIALLITLSSCSDKVLSAHGQENDYYHEQMVDKIQNKYDH